MVKATTGSSGACAAGSTPGHTTIPTTANCVASKLIPSIGAEIGYQHWWSDNLRSTFSYGVNHQYSLSSAYLGTGILNANRELQSAHANLIWNPVSFVTIGVEYMWGQRTVVQGNSAGPGFSSTIPNSQQVQTLIGKFDVAF